MKDQLKIFLDKVAEMREAQRQYFDCRKSGDQYAAMAFLSKCKILEKEVDKLYSEIDDKLNNGEQQDLFNS